MRTTVELLFDEFAATWARGEHPDARDYLERAGKDRDELGALLDSFLAAAPVQPPSEETLAVFAELVPGDHETPPMLAMRVRMGLLRKEVVRQLCSALGLGAEADARVAHYYHELETGLLDPRRVSSRVWHALATILGPAIRSRTVGEYEAPPVVVAAYFRRANDAFADASPESPDRSSGPPDRLLHSISEVGIEPSTNPRHEPPTPPPHEPVDTDEIDRLFTGGA